MLQAVKMQNLRKMQDLFRDYTEHTYTTLYAFVDKYDSAVTELDAIGYQWPEEVARDHFLMVVQHPFTQWMINACHGKNYLECIDFFRLTASPEVEATPTVPRSRTGQ